jgi:hypothetical protein
LGNIKADVHGSLFPSVWLGSVAGEALIHSIGIRPEFIDDTDDAQSILMASFASALAARRLIVMALSSLFIGSGQRRRVHSVHRLTLEGARSAPYQSISR